MSVIYRPEIDGLRALAVVPVVLFHARVAGFGGGFVGVDVFFVISGFLITSLIKQEIDAGAFSYLSFWERRARRLLPPMILVVATTCVAAYLILFPNDLLRFGRSVFALSLFVSNVHFWHHTGYFDAPADTIPLLHTWSLAVEEQFYLVFPAVLIALSLRRRFRVVGIALIGLASFGYSVWCVRAGLTSAFYLLVPRAWELMLGAALALSTIRPTFTRATANAFLLLGLGMIASSVYLYTETTPFPGFAALLPCVGTALIIGFGEQPTLARRLLDNGAAVYVGKLSYSIYLWHWPLLVMYCAWSTKRLDALTTQEIVVIVGATLLLSWLSLTLIENPIRQRKVLASRGAIFMATGSAMAVIGAIGLTTYQLKGFDNRMPSVALAIAKSESDWNPIADKCVYESANHTTKFCHMGPSGQTTPKFMLWGDSHSQALFPVVNQVAQEFGVPGEHASVGSCPPVIGVNFVGRELALLCRPFNDDMFERISNGNFDAVFLAAMWSNYPSADNLRRADGSGDGSDSVAILEKQLRETIDRLTAMGITVVIFEEAPYPANYRPAAFARAVWRGAELDSAGITLDDYRKRNEPFTRILNGIDNPGLKRISLTDELCPDHAFCPAVTDGHSNFIDASHFSTHGAARLAPAVRRVFEEIKWTSGGDRLATAGSTGERSQ